MKNFYKALLIKPYKENDLIFERVKVHRNNSLKQLYELLNCERIDIQERKINNKIYDFIFDDEYMINGKSEQAENITAFSEHNGQIIEIIFSNLIICGVADDEGKETDLNEENIKEILNSLVFIKNKTNNEHYRVLKYDI